MKFDKEKFSMIYLEAIDNNEELKKMEEVYGELELNGKTYAVVPENWLGLFSIVITEAVEKYIESLTEVENERT